VLEMLISLWYNYNKKRKTNCFVWKSKICRRKGSILYWMGSFFM